jgi:hypothetical protein
MEQMTERLKAMLERMEAKTDVNLKEMKEEMLAKTEARIDAKNEKFEDLRDTLVSRMDAHQARTEAN